MRCPSGFARHPALALAFTCGLALAADDEKITLDFVNADIQSVIKLVGQHWAAISSSIRA